MERRWMSGFRGTSVVLGLLAAMPGWALTPRPLEPGASYRVFTKSQLDGTLQPPPVEAAAKAGTEPVPPARPLTVTGSAQATYTERLLKTDDRGHATRTARLYESVDYRREIAGASEQLRLRKVAQEVIVDRAGGPPTPAIIWSPAGLLTRDELVLLESHTHVADLSAFLAPASIELRQEWSAPAGATMALLGLVEISGGGLRCQYLADLDHQGRPLAQIALSGTVTGIEDDPVGTRSQTTINGALYVDPATGRLVSLRALGDRLILDTAGKQVGALKVDYQLVLRLVEPPAGLQDAALAALPAAARPTDLLLTYENRGLGLRVAYPREWFFTPAPNQPDLIFYAGPNSLVIHLEAGDTIPTAEAYRTDVDKYLQEDKNITLQRAGPIRPTSDAPHAISGFRREVLQAQQARLLDYHVLRQGKRGATVAAGFDPADAARREPEVLAIMQSLEFFEPDPPPAKPSTANQPPAP